MPDQVRHDGLKTLWTGTYYFDLLGLEFVLLIHRPFLFSFEVHRISFYVPTPTLPLQCFFVELMLDGGDS